MKPEDAASNLAAWAHWLGIEHTPSWLTNPAIDHRTIYVSLGIAAVCAFIAWGIPALRQKRAGGTPLTAPRVSKPVELIVERGKNYETVGQAGVNRRRTVKVENRNNTDEEISDGGSVITKVAAISAECGRIAALFD